MATGNIAVRHELQHHRNLEAAFVDHLLIWANGLSGKLDKLLRPLQSDKQKRKIFNALKTKAQRINSQRNLVAHSGHFMNKTEATEIVALTKDFIEGIVEAYHADYKLPE